MARLGQNFLHDPNLLDAIVRDSELEAGQTVLEVGAGEGVLTRRLAEIAGFVHVIEIDRGLEPHLADLVASPGVDFIWGDAMKVDLGALEPRPTAMVANLPYSVAVPLLVRTMVELPSIERWTVMVQREIADRLTARAGTRQYGSPTATLSSAASIRIVRKVGREVFTPRPRVDSAVLSMVRTGPSPGADQRALIRASFAHRRKSLARSVDTVYPGAFDRVRDAVERAGFDPSIRAEAVEPQGFILLSELIGPLEKGDG
jgi:16S rRNA (adenine1518-N6/adenine1519-N6)-dimethyltransferase